MERNVLFRIGLERCNNHFVLQILLTVHPKTVLKQETE